MERRSLSFVAEACGGELVNGEPGRFVFRAGTDSRQTRPGDLFIALPGERFDGHDFLRDVVEAGAAAVMIERSKRASAPPDCAVILVDDCRKALGRLGARYRSDFQMPMIAVAGSNGKTTTKELIASVLRQRFNTLASEASFNNEVGVPHTLLRLEECHGAAVVEAGTNHPGELAPLLDWIRPGLGVLTSLGREHLQHFGGMDGVVQEEGALAESVPAGGLLVVNGDSPWTAGIVARTAARVVTAGFGRGNDCRIEHVCVNESGTSFRVAAHRSDLSGDFQVGLVGRHQSVNALFALAIGAELGMSAEEIRRGLAVCRPAKMRLQTLHAGGVRIINDAYNANADSMIAALETLRDLPCRGRRVAVLGEMAELGAYAPMLHCEVGRVAAECGIHRVFAVGRMAGETAGGASSGGCHATAVENACAAAREVFEFVRPGDTVLVKGSRSGRLEKVVEQLSQLLNENANQHAEAEKVS